YVLFIKNGSLFSEIVQLIVLIRISQLVVYVYLLVKCRFRYLPFCRRIKSTSGSHWFCIAKCNAVSPWNFILIFTLLVFKYFSIAGKLQLFTNSKNCSSCGVNSSVNEYNCPDIQLYIDNISNEVQSSYKSRTRNCLNECDKVDLNVYSSNFYDTSYMSKLQKFDKKFNTKFAITFEIQILTKIRQNPNHAFGNCVDLVVSGSNYHVLIYKSRSLNFEEKENLLEKKLKRILLPTITTFKSSKRQTDTFDILATIYIPKELGSNLPSVEKNEESQEGNRVLVIKLKKKKTCNGLIEVSNVISQLFKIYFDLKPIIYN
ncbi:hypothetical protein AGLY_017311, partial [Aphis glycines]